MNQLLRNISTIATLVLIFCTSVAFAKNHCPDRNELQKILSEREVSSESTLKQLTDLNQKNLVGAVPLSGLFTIDLADQVSVEKRIAEFKALLSAKSYQVEPFSTLLKCAMDGNSKARIQKLLNLSKEITVARLKFLSLPIEARNALVLAYQSQNTRNQDIEHLDELQQSTRVKLSEAQSNLDVAESNATGQKDAAERDLAGYQALVEKYLLDIETNQLAFLDYQRGQTTKYADFRKELGILQAAGAAKSGNELKQLYEKSAQIWRDLVDHIFDLYLDHGVNELPSVPQIPKNVSEPDFPVTMNLRYMAAFEKSQARYNEIESAQANYLKIEKEMISSLLLSAGSVRSSMFNRCRIESCEGVFDLNNELVHDIVREAKVVPFKAISLGISKSIEAKRKLGNGISGWVDIGRQILILLLFFMIPLVIFSFFNKITIGLERFRKALIGRSMLGHNRRTFAALWLGRLTPFFPWVAMWSATLLAQHFLRQTDIREIAESLVYLKMYFVYRAVRIALTSGIQFSFTQGSLEQLRLIQDQVTVTATRIARIGLLEFILLKATSDAVREALIYTILSSLMFWINILVVFYEASRWENEIWSSAKNRMKPSSFSMIAKAKGYKIAKLINPFLFLYLGIQLLVSVVVSRLLQLDVFKWIASEIFRKKLERGSESTTSGTQQTPADYLAHFKFRSAASEDEFVASSQQNEQEIAATINSWARGISQDDALILCGNRGMGKSSSMMRAKSLIKEAEVIYYSLQSKNLSKSDFFKMLSELLNSPINSAADFLNFDALLRGKRALLIDDFQNNFLSCLDGLEAYRTFLELASMRTKNIFWCIAINTRSWAYLNGVFGPDHFYGKTIEFSAWKDTEIQELILRRHRLTGYKLEFDDLIHALGNESSDRLSETEVQFFRLLWGQSRGNPRSALVYWLSAISWRAGKNLHVGVPTFLSSTLVTSMSEESHFVLAAITRHENLTLEEIQQVTCIPESIIRKSLKKGVDLEILWSDEMNRLRVTPKGQYLIDYHLLGKNFLHE